jgi:amino acid transporter
MPATEGEHSPAAATLLRGIGAAGIALIVLNSMIGAGIFALPARVADAAGAFSPWLFLVVGALFMTVVLAFSELSSYFGNTGGPVLYTRAAFGPTVGFSTGWVFYVSRITAFAANVSVMADYAGSFWPWLHGDLGRSLFIVIVVGILIGTNYVGVRDGVRTLAVFSLLKLAPLLLLILLGLREVDASLLPHSLPQLSDLDDVSLLVVYAFVGFESATVVSGEIRNPQRSMPRALMATVAAVAIFYFFIVLAYMAIIPPAERSSATLADAGAALFGSWGAALIALTAVFSIGGNLAAIVLAASRVTFALGEQRLLPASLGRVHPRFATPGNSLLLLGVLVLALALSGTFVVLAIASSLTRLITYMLCIAALPRVRRAADEATRAAAFRPPGGNAVPLLAFGLCLWMAAQSPPQAWLVTGMLLLVGLALHLPGRLRAGRAAAGPADLPA